MMCDLRTSNLELSTKSVGEYIGPGHGLESSRTAGAKSGCMQSGSSSRSRRNQGQQLKQTQSGSSS